MIRAKKFLAVAIFFSAFLLFFFFRLSKLDSLPVFVDEGIYVRWSQVMRTEPSLRFIPQTDGKQPLFMWATVPFFKISSDPLVAGRLVSVAAGFGTLLGLCFLSYLLVGDLLLVSLTALAYAVFPFSVFFDRMALADSLLGMFAVWSLSLSVLFSQTRKLEHAMFLGFAIGGGLLTKSPAVIFYLWLALSLFFCRPSKTAGTKQKTVLNLAIGLVLVFLISQAMYAILRLGPAFDMIGSRNQDYLFSWKEVFSHPLNPLLGNLKTTLSWFWFLFTPGLLLSLILGIFLSKKKKTALFLILISLSPLLGQATIAKVYTSRYILFAVLPLLVLVGLGLNWVLTRKGALVKLSAIPLLLLPLVMSLFFVFKLIKAPLPFDMRNGYLEEWTAGWGQKETAAYFIDLESKGERVVVFTEGYFGTLPDGLQIYTEGHANIIIVGSNPFVRSLPDGLKNTSPENERFFVLNKSRNHLSETDLRDLQLIKEYPKPARLDGTSEALQLYRYQPAGTLQ